MNTIAVEAAPDTSEHDLHPVVTGSAVTHHTATHPTGLHPAAPPPRRLETATQIDSVAAERAVADLLRALGQDLQSEDLKRTPHRVASALIEQLTPEVFQATTFPNSERYHGLVLVRDIPFHSLCEHHLLPFRGVAHIGYLPGERLLGLSKLARGLEFYSRRLQVQERLTRQVADWLERELHPRGVGVVLEAEHLCMSVRGVRAAGSKTTTSCFFGALSESGFGEGGFVKSAFSQGLPGSVYDDEADYDDEVNYADEAAYNEEARQASWPDLSL